MANRNSKAFKTVKIKAKDIASGASLQELEELYMFLEAKKTDANEAFRQAQIAAAKFQAAESERMLAEVKILSAASVHSGTIARERRWLVFKDGDSNNELTFEGVTEKLLRNNFRAQQSQIAKQLGDDDFGQMFENEDGDETDE